MTIAEILEKTGETQKVDDKITASSAIPPQNV
jgi:hypothetical protein